jgi:hypothetical protein
MIVVKKTEGKRLSARSGLDGVRHYGEWFSARRCGVELAGSFEG